MTNDVTTVPQIMISQLTLLGWFMHALHWVFGGTILVLLVNPVRQVVALRKQNGRNLSDRISAVGIIWGWLSLIVGILLTWVSLREASVLFQYSAGETDQSLLSFALLAPFSYSVIGLLLCTGTFLEAAIFRYVWIRKAIENNTPSQPIAGKPDSG